MTPPEDRRFRVLYIHPGPVPPSEDPLRNFCHHLGKHLDGDLVTLTWESPDEYRENLPRYRAVLGGFGYVARPRVRESNLRGRLLDFWHYVSASLRLVRSKGPYDAIVAYAPFRTGWAGALVSRLTGTPLIVQMVVNPFTSLGHHYNGSSRVRDMVIRSSVKLLLHLCDRVHLLYPAQAELFRGMRLPPVSAFANFTPLSLIEQSDTVEPYILFLGFPWKLKGVDILIRAFRKVEKDHPDVKLKIVGYCADRSEFEQLAEGSEQIEFSQALPQPEAMKLMSRCLFFVLPSRTEAMGRVLLEAWAAKKAVVGSRVDGIPHFIRHGENGLLFESENVQELAANLRTLLEDRDLAKRLGEAGRRRISESFTEDHYVAAFTDMIRSAAKNRPSPEKR